MMNNGITRRAFLAAGAGGLTAAALPRLATGGEPAPLTAKPSGQPANVLYILADDLGYADLSCFGSERVKTPHIDSLAAAGVRCTSLYGPMSVCSPNRASLLTGRHAFRHGLRGPLKVGTNLTGGLNLSEVLLSQLLKPHGYATGMFGKWHLGFGEGRTPLDRGFDEFYGVPGGGFYWFDKDKDLGPERMIRRGKEIVQTQGYGTDLFTDAVLDFLTRKKDGPFFAQLGFVAPHAPLVGGGPMAPEAYISRFDKKDRAREYLASIVAMDDAIGRILAKLDELGLAKNTLVVFLSDNGGHVPAAACNKPFSDGKFSTNEGGVRLCSAFRWPAILPAGRVCDDMLSIMDLFPLALAAAGASDALPKDRVIDGRDPLPTLAGKAPTPHELLVFGGGGFDVRSGPHKLRGGKLYNVVTDPGETRDLAAEKPEVVKELQSLLDQWRRSDRRNPR
jgi:arylsulfatase A-like enzyme